MGHGGACCPKYRTNSKVEVFQSSYTPPNSLHVFHLVSDPFPGLLWEPTQLNLDRLRHIQLCSPNSGNRTQNSSHALSLRPRFRPGLHGRGKCAVGRALVGTAGALPALHQDVSAPGKGLGGDSNFGQVTTAPFLESFGRFQIGGVAWCGGFNCCMSGRLSFTDIVRRSIFSGI